MKFYVATAFANKEQQREVARALQGLGPAWRQTYDWTVNERARAGGAELMARVTAEEIDGIVAADLVVVLLPGGRGTHVELGVVAGLNQQCLGPRRRIVVWSWDGSHFDDPETCAFYFAPGVERVTGPLSELVAYLS